MHSGLNFAFRRTVGILVAMLLLFPTGCAARDKAPASSPSSTSTATPAPTAAPTSAPRATPSPTPAPAVDPGDPLLILANPEHPLPEDYTVETELVQDTHRLDKRAAPYMREMLAAAKADGVSLIVCSSYRSMEKQTSLFDRQTGIWMSYGYEETEAANRAATEVARPGTSEHQAGLAADIVTPSYQTLDDGFENTDAFRWLDEHAAEYGFILRFPKDKQEITKIIYEPWHYRFVGLTHAKEIKTRKICLEEYLDAAPQNTPTAAAK